MIGSDQAARGRASGRADTCGLTSLLLNNRGLLTSRRLAETEELLDFAYVSLIHGGEVGEVTLLLLRLLG